MKWPWQGDGNTEQRNYTQSIVQQIEAAATGRAGRPSAVEIASGQVSRGFASGRADGRSAALFTAPVLARMGREMIRNGETVWVARGGLSAVMAYDIQPDGSYSVNGRGTFPATDVLHARYAVDAQTLRGIAPIDYAPSLRDLLLNLEGQLRDEANTPTGFLLAIPADGDDVDQLRTDLKQIKGRVALVKTTQGGWDQGRSAAPRREYEPQRFGMHLPPSTVDIYRDAQRNALGLMGVPVELVEPGDGTGQREAWRRFLHGTIQPLARIIEAAARAAGLNVSLSFDGLMASDIAGRARAFQSLVGGGMDVEQAAAISGLIVED